MDHVFVKLFEVRIWHDYFFLEDAIPERIPVDYKIKGLAKIVPSKRTKRILESYNLIYKTTDAGFMVIARVEEGATVQTFSRFEERVQFSFFIQATDPVFTIFTNLPLQDSSQYVYYFDNLEANTIEIDGKPIHYLSSPMAGYGPWQDLEMGQLVREQGRVFEVIDIPVTEAPLPDILQDSWSQGKNTQYVTGADRVQLGTHVFRFNGPNQAPGQEVTFTVQNRFGENVELGFQPISGHAVPMGKAVYPNDPAVNLKHDIIFNMETEGLYSIFLDGEALGSIYLIPGREIPAPLGVIDLFYTPPGSDGEMPGVPDGFGFIDSGPVPDAPLSIPTGIVYNLHLKSRMTFRRFISGSQVTVYPRPLPLSRAFAGLVVDAKKMPDPSVLSIDREVDVVGGRIRERYYSNIYV